MARPSLYTEARAKIVCDLIAEGASLRTIGEMRDMPSRRTMRGWLQTHEEFEHAYEIARRERTDNLIDESIEIADSVAGCTDNAAVQAARLRVDTRRWLASKLLPERYGDRITTELTGAGGKDLIPAEPMDDTKIALFLLNLFNGAEGGKNDPAALAPSPAMIARSITLLSAPAEQNIRDGADTKVFEPAPVPVAVPVTRLGEPIFDARTGEKQRPLFDVATGRVLRFVSARGGEQG